jgi:CCT motif
MRACLQAFPLQPASSAAALRKAALERFRAKKAKRQFAPKVRYAARKKLAEARPRFKGQFVRAHPPAAAAASAAGLATTAPAAASAPAAATAAGN